MVPACAAMVNPPAIDLEQDGGGIEQHLVCLNVQAHFPEFVAVKFIFPAYASAIVFRSQWSLLVYPFVYFKTFMMLMLKKIHHRGMQMYLLAVTPGKHHFAFAVDRLQFIILVLVLIHFLERLNIRQKFYEMPGRSQLLPKVKYVKDLGCQPLAKA